MTIEELRLKRCEDCACLVMVGGRACCDECFNQSCVEIDDCPEDVTLEELQELEKKAKENKIDHGAKAETDNKTPKPHNVKVSDTKKALFSEIFSNIDDYCQKNSGIATVEKENKLIIVQIDGKIFKIDLIEQRKPKK